MVDRDERLFFVDICVASYLAIPNDKGDSTSGQSVSIAVYPRGLGRYMRRGQEGDGPLCKSVIKGLQSRLV